MAYTPWETYMDTVPVPSTVEELQQALQIKYNTSWQNIADTLTSYGADPNNFDDLANLCNVKSISSVDGSATMWYYGDLVDDFSFTPNPTVSTDSYTSITHVRTPINTSVDDVTGKVVTSQAPKVGSFATNAAYLAGEVNQAWTAASVGIWLGKEIDRRLYNANPDFFDANGMGALNPDTWASITNGDDSLGATLFNFVFGIDTDTGNAQAYIDADAAAYMAYWLKQQNAFNSQIINPTEQIYYTQESYNIQANMSIRSYLELLRPVLRNTDYGYIDLIINGLISYGINVDSLDYICGIVSYSDNDYLSVNVAPNITGWRCTGASRQGTTNQWNYLPQIEDSQGALLATFGRSASNTVVPDRMIIHSGYYRSTTYPFIMNNYTAYKTAGVEGIDDQPSATQPDTSTWADIPTTDSYLRSTYPNTYNDALQYDVVQPDGTVLTKTYIPVPFPQNLTSPNTQNSNDPWNNPQPTSDNAKQNVTVIQPDLLPDDFIKELIKTITQTVQTTNTDNPTTTGTGDTPPLVPIAGTSTALWSVYNPTKAQIDSFGAWLWTDNVIQQFIQLLNNPMEGIITLHKVFASPVVSSVGTIVVGRLDSGVSSNLVAQQYVTVDCGSINVNEYFGSVFDYSPYTKISLYLPFIGFVPLNVDDVMRSTISITYGVDVFTGACLATVNVDRDGNSVGLYQYSGVASVEYPLTGAQHGGLVNGLLGVAGGVAGIAFASTGVGVVAGASSIAGGLANAAKTSNARSGGFSGNAGAMGVKIPYLIIERPITKVADTFSILDGYPTNYSVRLGDCSNHVVCKTAHVHGINATKPELEQIENYLLSGVEI